MVDVTAVTRERADPVGDYSNSPFIDSLLARGDSAHRSKDRNDDQQPRTHKHVVWRTQEHPEHEPRAYRPFQDVAPESRSICA